MTFAMVVTRQPKSSSSTVTKEYERTLAPVARAKMAQKPPLVGSLYIRINWFFNKPGGPDLDNIIKSIVDSMKSIVYPDDALFVKCLACKYDLTRGRPIISDKNIPLDVSDIYEELIEELGTRWDGILYIEVGEVTLQAVLFGEADGGEK